MLQTLYLRCSLIAQEFELGPLSASSFDARFGGYHPDPDEDPNNEYYETSLVDTNDARIVLQGYITRVAGLAQGSIPDELLLTLLEFIKQDVILDIADLMPAFIKVSCALVWKGIDITANSPKHKHTSEVTTVILIGIRIFDIIACVNFCVANFRTR